MGQDGQFRPIQMFHGWINLWQLLLAKRRCQERDNTKKSSLQKGLLRKVLFKKASPIKASTERPLQKGTNQKRPPPSNSFIFTFDFKMNIIFCAFKIFQFQNKTVKILKSSQNFFPSYISNFHLKCSTYFL